MGAKFTKFNKFNKMSLNQINVNNSIVTKVDKKPNSLSENLLGNKISSQCQSIHHRFLINYEKKNVILQWEDPAVNHLNQVIKLSITHRGPT